MAKTVVRLSADMGSIKARLELLAQQIEDEDDGGEDLAARVEALELRVDEQTEAAATVHTRLDAIENTLRTGIGALTSRLSVLGDRLTENDEALDELKAALDTGTLAPAAVRVVSDDAPTNEVAAPDTDLRRIKGIGPKFEKALKNAGVRTIRQIAEWKSADVDAMADKIGIHPDRIRRSGWVTSARALLDA